MSEQAYVIAVPQESGLSARLWGAGPKEASEQKTSAQALPGTHHRRNAAKPGATQAKTMGSTIGASTTDTPETMTGNSLSVEAGISAPADVQQVAAGLSSPEALLFREFLSGSDQAFTKLFKAHNQRIFAYCFKMLGSEEQAQDVAQEVWEKVIELRNDPPEVENPIGFLMRITRNKCLDVIKLRKNHSSLSDLDDHQHPYEEEHEGSAEEDIVLRALEQLPPDQKEVLVLNIYSGYRFDEIAEMLGKSPDAIWARASRGRATLRKIVMEAMSGNGLSNRYKDTGKNATKTRKNGKEEAV